MNVLVPPEGSKWEKTLDYPNKEEVQIGTIKFISENHPHLLKLAYHYVLEEYNIDHDNTIYQSSMFGLI